MKINISKQNQLIKEEGKENIVYYTTTDINNDNSSRVIISTNPELSEQGKESYRDVLCGTIKIPLSKVNTKTDESAHIEMSSEYDILEDWKQWNGEIVNYEEKPFIKIDIREEERDNELTLILNDNTEYVILQHSNNSFCIGMNGGREDYISIYVPDIAMSNFRVVQNN